MSYEGFEICLCENGHVSGGDCYSANFLEPDWRCTCGARKGWWQPVDQTNCGGHEYPCEQVDDGIRERCEHCNSVTKREMPKYKIPSDEEIAAWRKTIVCEDCGCGMPEPAGGEIPDELRKQPNYSHNKAVAMAKKLGWPPHPEEL